MRTFLLKLVGFTAVTIPILVFLAWIGSDGYADDFYLKFTTPPASSMVLGSSRPAQGVLPHLFNSELEGVDFEGPLFNFAFTTGNSPYGPYYYRAIKRKLDPETTKGVFILAVDPWHISLNPEVETNEWNFREKNRAPGNMRFQSMMPNIEYLMKNYNGGLRELLQDKSWSRTELQPDGWLKVSIDTSRTDIIARKFELVEEYILASHEVSVSEVRAQYLKKTIEFLKQNGDVILVHMPISSSIREVEENYFPGFNDYLVQLSSETGVPFLNYSHLSDEFTYIDGHHLYLDDGERFTRMLGKDIRKILISEE